MVRRLTLTIAVALTFGTVALALAVSPWWWILAAPVIALTALAIHDAIQTEHSVLRNFPLLGHLRYLLEGIRPELQQYFVESDTLGTPFNRNDRSIVYQRAKQQADDQPFGTERDLYAVGSEWLIHSIQPVTPPETPHRHRLGGPQASKPYDIALLNVSAMSFGSISSNAILAMNAGAKRGGFAQSTGEGGLSTYHLEHGGDLIWEIGSGYFGCRTEGGDFDPAQFTDKSQGDTVKAIELKLSQGAKPGIGGVMPAAKMTREIADARGVPVGETCISPPGHSAFSGPIGLLEFVAELRERSGGKPTGFKLCVGSRREVLAICKAMLQTGIMPDFIVVDGSEGGTGAAPLEFSDSVGTPLTEGLTIVRDALVGCDLKQHISIGASGKIASGADIVKRLAQGADYTNSARAMMMAVGCIQAQRCHTNRCPVGVATQDPTLVRGLDVADKADRVFHYQRATVQTAARIIGAMGLDSPDQLEPRHLMRRIAPDIVRSYAHLHPQMEPGQLLAEPPAEWAHAWNDATATSFR